MNCLHVLGTVGGAVYVVCVLAVIGFIAVALVKMWWEGKK